MVGTESFKEKTTWFQHFARWTSHVVYESFARDSCGGLIIPPGVKPGICFLSNARRWDVSLGPVADDVLPTALKSYVDGRLGKLEDRLSSLSFRQSVEMDMMAGVLADGFQFSQEDLRRRRAESVSNVKRTNGRISLEKYAREVWEDEE